MFYIIDTTTGEVLTGPISHEEVAPYLRDELPDHINWADVFVQADCESGFGMGADDWMGVA